MTNSYIAVDLETTGLRPGDDRILEIGALKVEAGVVTDSFEMLVNPGHPVPYRITEITGITTEMVQDAPDIRMVMKEFLNFSGTDVILGHNVLFDYGFLRQNAVELGYSYEREALDTLTIAKLVLPQLTRRTLDAMAAYCGIVQEHHHRALDDARTASLVYQKLAEEFEQVRPDLFQPKPLNYKVKKNDPITSSQKRYLQDLLKYHKIESTVKMEMLTKREASRMIDSIILNYGKIKR